jgi:hypothetical protein
MQGFLLDSDTIERLAKMLLAFEGGKLGGAAPKSIPLDSTAPILHLVRITSTTKDGQGNYPAKIQFYDAYSNSYTDVEGDVSVKEITGQNLLAQRYIGRLAGYNSYGANIYQVSATGTAGATSTTTTPSYLSVDFVAAISCNDGEILPIYTNICIPGAYYCYATTTTSTAAPTTTSTTSTGGG